MVKKEIEVKTTKTIYVTADGVEFENENDCRAWEKSYCGTVNLSWEKLNKRKICTVEYGLEYGNEDDEAFMLCPDNLDEIVIINAFIEMKTGNNGTLVSAEHIGKTIILNFGYEYDFCEVWEMESRLAKLRENWETAKSQLLNKES